MDSLCVCVRMCSAHGQEKNEKVEIAMESVGGGGGVCVSVCVCIYINILRGKKDATTFSRQACFVNRFTLQP